MTEHPIIFSTPMVQAILAGRKTMTRRINGLDLFNKAPDKWRFSHDRGDGYYCFKNPTYKDGGNVMNPAVVKCPYGVEGDLLWVRETWCMAGRKADNYNKAKAIFKADLIQEGSDFWLMKWGMYRKGKWKPSIHMPKELARIWLKVEEIRVDRLNGIKAGDAMMEGVEKELEGWRDYSIIHSGRYKGEQHPHAVIPFKSPVTSFMSLWETIHGEKSWVLNPWVWVIKFSVVKK